MMTWTANHVVWVHAKVFAKVSIGFAFVLDIMLRDVEDIILV